MGNESQPLRQAQYEQYDRTLPGWHLPDIGSRVLSLTERRVVTDWEMRFGHRLLLLETFVDPSASMAACTARSTG